jgi:hypothetical protein
MDGEERERLNSGIAIASTEQRWCQYDKETEDENRDSRVQVHTGRAAASAQQQHCNANQCDE